jgi:hypothetical protein
MPQTNHSGVRQQMQDLKKENERLRKENAQYHALTKRMRETDALDTRLRNMLVLMQRFRTSLVRPCQLIETTVGNQVHIRLSLFGSAMTSIMCRQYKGIPGDLDVQVIVDGVDDQLKFFSGLLQFMQNMPKCIGPNHLETEVVSQRTSYRGVMPLNVITARLTGLIDNDTQSVDVDFVVATRLPSPDTVATGWRFGVAHNGALSIYNGGLKAGDDPFDACLSLLSKETRWTGPPIQPGDPHFAFLVGTRLLKNFDMGFQVTHALCHVSVSMDCPVCLNKESVHVVNGCGHTMCLTCISKMRDLRCPICRADLTLLPHDADLPNVTQRLIADASENDGDGGGGAADSDGRSARGV